MNEREKILGRIREALRVPAPKPAHSSRADPAAVARWNARAFSLLLPRGAATPEERLSLFCKNATDLKAEFHLLGDREELARFLQRLSEKEKWVRMATHAGELTDFATGTLRLPVCRTDAGYEARELESCSVAVTECDALVAQTGSVLVTSRTAGGRALSVLPPHHIVLARRDQLISGLPEAFALLRARYSDNYPSFISFITGPSRTGDIERILVLGAHGPKRLTILCL